MGSYWLLNQSIVELPTEKRVRRWGISPENLMTDPLGAQELLAYMKKEYCHENLRFWLAVQDLRYGPGTDVKIRKKVKEIWIPVMRFYLMPQPSKLFFYF